MESKPKFDELIKNSETPVLVDFYADWCGPCQTMAPVLEKISEDYKGKLKVIKVNVDKNPAASTAFNVQGIPTFILFHKGSILWRQAGAIPGFELKKVIENAIFSASAKTK